MVLAQGAIPFPVNDRRVAVVGAGVSGLTAPCWPIIVAQ